jgi:ribonuclease Z
VPGYSDFIVSGRWEGVEDVLREIYREASEALGREFPYPGDDESDGD